MTIHNYWPETINSTQWFTNQILMVDALAEVHHQIEIPFAIRIRPSHPRYREAIIEKAKQARCMGVLVSVVKEVDDWQACIEVIEAPHRAIRLPKRSFKQWLKRLLK